ncbi:MAG: class I SAM-dependent methyltransferase [Deltaproteobacteria bacterium]|nr:class I SAM-dependent methyltransferase [Deltaproteobacteria bacterium]
MSYKQKYYPESRFGGFSDLDGTIIFYTRVNSLIMPEMVVLDIGCGRGKCSEDKISYRKNLQTFRGKCKKVIGLDIDADARQNPYIDEFLLINGEKWPLLDGSIDLAICDAVLEHIPDPDIFFGECKRVIKNGGYLCIRTPNKFSYFGLISHFIPNKYHSRVLKIAQPERKEVDVFPAYYKINTIRGLRAYLNKYGFDHCVYGYEEEPSYLSFSKIAYWFGVLHQKFSPKMIKVGIFAFGKKL